MKMLFYWLIIQYNIILMVDNDQSTIIEAPEVYKSIPTHSPSKNQRQSVPGKKFQLWHLWCTVMVNYIEPNLQEIIFGPIRVGLITQKQFLDHLKNCHSWGRTPYCRGQNWSTIHGRARHGTPTQHAQRDGVASTTFPNVTVFCTSLNLLYYTYEKYWFDEFLPEIRNCTSYASVGLTS